MTMKNFKRELAVVPRVRLIALALIGTVVLAACGGGGGSPGATGAGAVAAGAGVAGTPGEVQFVSVVPAAKIIAVKGKGANTIYPESATVVFKAIDTQGNPLVKVPVTFAVTSPFVQLSAQSVETSTTGTVSATVVSGTSPVTFRVQVTLTGTARNNNPDLMGQSDAIQVIVP